MGKTTWLQQFAITLTLDTETPTINELFGKNKPLPIFVPLKILDNATPRPILTYIRSLPLFSGSQGFRRLIHLASRGELLFLVDGYDEIYIPAEDGPSIKAEIDSLFSGKLEEVQGDQTPLPELTQFYRSLYKNRVWLSTRREYYLLNRLRLDEEETTRFVYPPIAAVEILGLGLESRNQLVKKIFDKYRAKSLVLNEKLSEDEFFLFLSRTHTDETTSLFENPLFLTVMCYLYTKTVENGNLDPSHPTLNLRSLIIQCLRVLLKDLDTYRVRNLPRRIVNALMEKRGLYSDKKLDFLRFLAARSLSDRRYLERSALDEEEIRALAREYFTSMSRDNEVDEILRNLESKDVANNLVRQLILQGVFVLVDRTDAGEFFDFPHSSFRYILALEYFEKYEFNCALIHLDYLAKRDFVITMFQLSETHRDLILETLFSRYKADKNETLVALLRECLRARPSDYDPSTIIEGWIRRVYNDPDIASTIPKLLEFVNPTLEFLMWADRNLVNALTQLDKQRIRTFGTILSRTQPKLFCEHVSEMLRSTDDSTVVCTAELLLHSDGSHFVREFLGQNQTGRVFKLMARVLLQWKTLSGREDWWKEMCQSISDHQRAVLFVLSLECNPGLAPRVLGFQRHDKLWSVPEMRKYTDDEGLFVVVDAISELLIDIKNGRDALMRVGEGYFAASSLRNTDFLEKRVPRPSYEETAKQIYPGWMEEKRKNIASELRNREITDEEATSRQQLLKHLTIEHFMHAECRLIEHKLAEIHDENVAVIREFVERRMFWSKDRWMSFLDAVEQETSCLGVVSTLSRSRVDLLN